MYCKAVVDHRGEVDLRRRSRASHPWPTWPLGPTTQPARETRCPTCQTVAVVSRDNRAIPPRAPCRRLSRRPTRGLHRKGSATLQDGAELAVGFVFDEERGNQSHL